MGSKSKIAENIIKLFPYHERYIEVFGGSGAVLFAKDKSNIEIYNDGNANLVAMFYAIKYYPEEFKRALEAMMLSRDIWNYAKEECKKELNIKNRRERIERGVLFYYLICLSFGSKGGTFGGKMADIKNKDFLSIAKRLEKVMVENLDYVDLIKKYDDKDALFYIDPPYLNTEKYHSQKKRFNQEEFVKLFDLLKTIKGKFILSHNDNEVIRAMSEKFYTYEIEHAYCINSNNNKQECKELCIMNFNPVEENVLLCM